MTGKQSRMAEFHHALRILRNIDRYELEANGIDLRNSEWFHFRSNPYDWFIRAEHEDAVRVWHIIDNKLKGQSHD